MANIMAETESYPRFSRLTEGKAVKSWRSAVPAVVVIVALVALLGYLASSLTANEQRAMNAERDQQQTREQMTGLTKQIATLQKDDALAKSPGRTTVLLQPQAKDGKKGAKAAKDSAAWAAVTWGELPDGKSFMRVNAYGLLENRAEGQDFHVWFQPQTGDPVDLGALEVDASGSGYAMANELPPVDQGKSVMLTQDAAGAKQPGTVVAKADLPKLQPTAAAPGAAPAGNDLPQAKSGGTSQQMHQEQTKPAQGDQPKAQDQQPLGK